MFNLLNTLKEVCKEKEIYIKCDDEIIKDYPIVSTLYLDDKAKDNIDNLIFEIFNENNLEAGKVQDLFYSLIEIEKLCFGNIKVDDTNQDVINYNYKQILDNLNKHKNICNLLIDKKNKFKIMDCFKSDNIEKILEFNKELNLTNYENILDVFKGVKKVFDYFKVDKDCKLIFDASLLYGIDSPSELVGIINTKEDLEKVLTYFDEVNVNIIKIKSIFKDYKNSIIRIDDNDILLKNLKIRDLDELGLLFHDLIVDSILELGNVLKNEKLDTADSYEQYSSLMNKMCSNLSDVKSDKKISSIKETLKASSFKDKDVNFIKKIVKKNNLTIEERVNHHFKNIIGLQEVKQEVTDMINFCNKLKYINQFSMANSHMCFVGNPGTGKTTVARIVADILYQEGFLKNNKVKEIGGVDLQAAYVGQTAPKVQQAIKDSEGGILFIDEAYQIVNAGRDNDSYGKEALAVLIKQMEDNPNLMTIFAGYEKPTQEMIKVNPGLASRISTTLKFNNYSSDELLKIANIVASSNKFILDDKSLEVLKTYIDKHINDENFANGRFVKNLVVKAERMQTRRAKTEDFVLLPEDFNKVIEEEQKLKQTSKKTIGFQF